MPCDDSDPGAAAPTDTPARVPADPLPLGFRDVDATAPAKIVDCLEGIAALPSGRDYKQRILARLAPQPGLAVLDVACGLGDDVAALAACSVEATGVDRSHAMVAEAQRRHGACGARFQVAEATALPFPAERFDAVRIDRALQHIEDPAAVVGEMARVVRPGGLVIAAEPDWGTFLIAGAPSPLIEAMEQRWRLSFRNPWIGRQLPSLFEQAALVEGGQEAVWLDTEGVEASDRVFEIAALARQLAPQWPEALPWLERFRAGPARAGVLILLTWARKPLRPDSPLKPDSPSMVDSPTGPASTARHLSWQEFDAAVERIVAFGAPPNCSGVYGIPRGGLVLAVALSHRLALPLLSAPQPRCLVVDEVAETGRSLEPFHQLEGVRLVVWISKIEPRGWQAVETTTAADWLVFPWEDPRRAAADAAAYRRSRG